MKTLLITILMLLGMATAQDFAHPDRPVCVEYRKDNPDFNSEPLRVLHVHNGLMEACGLWIVHDTPFDYARDLLRTFIRETEGEILYPSQLTVAAMQRTFGDNAVMNVVGVEVTIDETYLFVELQLEGDYYLIAY